MEAAEGSPKTDAAIRKRILDAAIIHAGVEGWSEPCFDNAVADSGIDPKIAASFFPKGPVDLALEFHRDGDNRMVEAMKSEDFETLGITGKVANAVFLRLQVDEGYRHIVRRSMSLFALPMFAVHGGTATWGTADRIWTFILDDPKDFNWYTKRATLSAVISASALYWLSDSSENCINTREFINRRIDNVLALGKVRRFVDGFRDDKNLGKGVLNFLNKVGSASRSGFRDR